MYDEMLVKAIAWEPQNAVDFVYGQWTTRVLQKEIEEEVLLRGAMKANNVASSYDVNQNDSEDDPGVPWRVRYMILFNIAFTGDYQLLAYVSLLSVIQVLSLLGFTVNFGILLDDASTTQSDGRAGRLSGDLVGGLMMFGAVSSMAVLAKNALVEMSASRFQVRLSETVMAFLSLRPPSWFETPANVAILDAKLEPSILSVREDFYKAQIAVLWSLGQVVCGLAGMGIASPMGMVAMFFLALLLTAGTVAFKVAVQSSQSKHAVLQAKRAQIASEIVSMGREMRMYGTQRQEASYYSQSAAASGSCYERLALAHAVYLGAMVFLLFACLCIYLVVVAPGIETITVSVGGLVTGAAYALLTFYYLQEALEEGLKVSKGMHSAMLFWKFLNLDALTQSLSEAYNDETRRPVATKVGELLQHPEDADWVDKGVRARCRGPNGGFVRFQKVDYTYPYRPGYKILDSFTMEVPSKQILGLMGHAGCGKTTLAKLLLRRARPDRGSVSVDGVDIHDFDRSYNEQVTLLSSEPVVFNGTVFENIAYGLVGRSSGTRAEEDDVIQAAKLSDLHRFVSMLPKQYDTVLGEEGVHLPVHALKRMMIARAYLRNAAVVIADTLIPYDLEPQAAGGLRTALRRLLRFPIRRTGIIISSNPDDFEMCDMLACMHGGALQEYGSTPLVMSNVRSYYHTLVEMNAPNRKKMDGLTPMRTPGGTAVIGNDQEVAEPVFEMISGRSKYITDFKHPVAAGKHNQIHPQPDFTTSFR